MVNTEPRSCTIINSSLPLIIGVVAFFLLIGPRVLDPTNIAWLGMSRDPANSFLGWGFSRHSSWSFPIGLNPGYALGLSSAIIYSDSNPLLALLFKPFSPWLPEPFQYFGVWLFICFILQAWFGWELVALFTTNRLNCALGATFFIFAPPMLFRAAPHLNLAALFLSLKQHLTRRKLAWGAILVVAALVHAYLLAMVALLWLADLVAKRAVVGLICCQISRRAREITRVSISWDRA